MRILVISDSHGRTGVIEDILEKHSDIKIIFFLGDCVRDIEDITYCFGDRKFYIVEGNCDGYTMYKTVDCQTVNSKRVLFTHGHTLGVKGGYEKLRGEAERHKADLVLFGHTHIATIEYANGIYYVNPGSVCSGRCGYTSYAIVDLVDEGIVPNIIKIR